MDCVLRGCVTATVAAGSTVYLGPAGVNSNESLSIWPLEGRYAVLGVYAAFTAAPGTSETFTFTLRKGIADTSMTSARTDTGTFVALLPTAAPQVITAFEDVLDIKLVTERQRCRGWVSLLHLAGGILSELEKLAEQLVEEHEAKEKPNDATCPLSVGNPALSGSYHKSSLCDRDVVRLIVHPTDDS
jgi:hypothetical protein